MSAIMRDKAEVIRHAHWTARQGDDYKDLGVFNIAGALPFSIAPAIAP
jgi:hypothetical protein